MKIAITILLLAPAAAITLSSSAAAKSCTDLRSLCWTMRSDKGDCTLPFQRCLKTGTFITPLGRVFHATSKR